MNRFVLCLTMLLLWASSALAQTVPGPLVHFAWDANPETDIAGYRFITETSITDVGNVTDFVATFSPGPHVVGLTAYNTSGLVSKPATLSFTIAPQVDPCTSPFSGHQPFLTPTSPTQTSGKPGSKSFLNYQIGGQDRVIEVSVQIDGVDQPNVGRATGPTDDLKDFSGRWFTVPDVGTHTLGIRMLTSFGCALTKQTAFPLVVKP